MFSGEAKKDNIFSGSRDLNPLNLTGYLFEHPTQKKKTKTKTHRSRPENIRLKPTQVQAPFSLTSPGMVPLYGHQQPLLRNHLSPGHLVEVPGEALRGPRVGEQLQPGAARRSGGDSVSPLWQVKKDKETGRVVTPHLKSLYI